jgi:hypothetical protein
MYKREEPRKKQAPPREKAACPFIYLYDKDPVKDGDNPPIGALFLRVIDIMHYHAKYSASDDSTRINAWFAIAPVGKARFTIYYSKSIPDRYIQAVPLLIDSP